MRTQTLALVAALFTASALYGQESVCDLFKDLKAADGRQLIIQGELIISKDLAVLGAADCDNEYVSDNYGWPTALSLHPSTVVPAKQIQQFRDAAIEADRLRRDGKLVSASATFS